MNSDRIRRTAAEVAIGLLVCGAAHLFLIGPHNARLARLQAEAEALAAAPSAGPALSAEQVATLTRLAARWADEVTRRSESARDDTRLFTAIMTLAESSGVRIDQLQPTGRPEATRKPPSGPSAEGTAPADGSLPASSEPAAHGGVGYGMVVSAEYGRLAAFLAALQREIGFTVVRSVRLEPDDSGDGSDRVLAHVQTEHYWFDASQLRALAGAGLPAAGSRGEESP